MNIYIKECRDKKDMRLNTCRPMVISMRRIIKESWGADIGYRFN
jgi:hypothetical protein